MSELLSAIQEILLNQKINELRDLKYKNLISYTKPKPEPFDYFVIDSPPSNESDQTKNELNSVISLSNKRTEQDILNILYIDKDPLYLYTEFLNRHELSFPIDSFSQLYTILHPIIKELKLFFNRPRPNQIAEFYDLDVDVLHTKTHATASYPSGHVAYAKLAELVSIDHFPQYIDYFRSFTAKVGLARMQQGVHFISDNEASIRLVSKIFPKLKQAIL